MVGDVAILHGFFVWPKLIAASFLLAGFALVISPTWKQLRSDYRGATLLAILCGLAMLAHGSSVFGVVPLLVLAFWGGFPSWRWLGVGALVGIALLAPWSAYQKYVDPPGDRLLKWQLGGQLRVDDRGTLDAIVDGYREAGLGGALHNKKENFVTMIGGTGAVDRVLDSAGEALDGRFGEAVAGLRGVRFFFLIPSLGLLLIGPIAMLVAWARHTHWDERDWRLAILCFVFTAIACVIWGLALFGTLDSRTTIHVGSLAVPLLATVGCVAGLRAVWPRIAAWIVALNALGVLLLYVPSLTPPPGSSYSALAAVASTLALAGFCLVAFRDDIEPA